MSVVKTKTVYDEVPYISYPFEISRPERLAANAAIFGMTPPKIETARVLELGGASGNNVIRFAADYPKSKVVCVDLSSVQIVDGQKYVEELGLKNIELKAMSITDIDESFGEFDYIICHGVFSWVPEVVREKILEICNKNLAKDGVAYISYNTLPGWNMVGTVRDMMMFHSENFADVNDQVIQSKLFLEFVSKALKENTTPYAKFLQDETKQLSNKSVHYLRHEHLSEENQPFYFHQFIDMAVENGLTYLADTHLHTMYLGNMPEKVREQLGTINDIVRSEQYMDFIRNRRFRATLLCKQGQELQRDLLSDNVQNCYFKCTVKYDGDLSKVKLQDGKEFVVETSGGQTATSKSAITTALFVSVLENLGQYFSIPELVEMVKNKGLSADIKDIEHSIYTTIMQLLLAGHADAAFAKPQAVYTVSNKPVASAVARAQIKLNPAAEWVTGQHHSPVPVVHVYKELIQLLDGTRTHKQLVKELVQFVLDGKLAMNVDDKKLTEKSQIEKGMMENLDDLLNDLAANHLLIK